VGEGGQRPGKREGEREREGEEGGRESKDQKSHKHKHTHTHKHVPDSSIYCLLPTKKQHVIHGMLRAYDEHVMSM